MPYKDPIRRREYHSEYGKKHYKEYYTKNSEEISEKSKKYHLEHREVILQRQEKYRIDNADRIKILQRDYRKNNKDKINKDKNNRMKVDIQFKLGMVLRNRIRLAIKNGQKAGSAVKDLGCTIPELKFYLEGQFQDGMTWGNWSLKGWHIDHKIPLDFYDLADREQFLQACHYTNLQPMWAKENIKKSNILPIGVIKPSKED